MNYNYDDERPGAAPPSDEAPDISKRDAAGENILPETSAIPGFYTPQTAYTPQAAHSEAPDAIIEEQPAEPVAEAPQIGVVHSAPVIPQPWRDPSYSAVPSRGPNVYSPGFTQPAERPRYRPEHREEQQETDIPHGGRKRRGGFMRAACLVVVCALASSAATLGVLEYRLGDTDNAPATEQTQSAGKADGQVDGGFSTPAPDGTEDQVTTSPTPGVVTQPMVSSGIAMSAQDIYDMACNQVAVVRTSVAAQGGRSYITSGTSVISGSGFIIREDGYIVTNYHVVETAYNGTGELTVTLNNGEEYPAVIIGVEPGSDIAVIKIDATSLNSVTVGDSSAMRVGEIVYAVGNPLGELVYTMTDGMISALDREITVGSPPDDVTMNMFQISAAVNSGNSGGPVYDTYGHVIGVVTAKFNDSMVEGIGFAIPINDVMRIAGQLMENGYMVDSKAYFGITVETINSATAEYYNWVVGAYVRSVEPGSCADTAGLKVGDIITKVGNINVTSQASLLYAKKCFNAGDTTEIVVRRSGEDLTLTITFDTEPETEVYETTPSQMFP